MSSGTLCPPPTVLGPAGADRLHGLERRRAGPHRRSQCWVPRPRVAAYRTARHGRCRPLRLPVSSARHRTSCRHAARRAQGSVAVVASKGARDAQGISPRRARRHAAPPRRCRRARPGAWIRHAASCGAGGGARTPGRGGGARTPGRGGVLHVRLRSLSPDAAGACWERPAQVVTASPRRHEPAGAVWPALSQGVRPAGLAERLPGPSGRPCHGASPGADQA
jgi:hypothetical protein